MAKKPTIRPRKPPTATAAQLEQFVAGSAPRAREGKTTIYTRKTGESAGEDLRRVTLYFPADLHKRAKHAAVEADVPLSELVVAMVAKALEKK